MYVSDIEHFIAAVDSGECDRLPEPVWERESHSDRRSRDRGDTGKHGGGGCVL